MAGFTEYTLPTSSPTDANMGRRPTAACLGSDNNVWYVSIGGAARVSKIAPDGTVTEYSCPDTSADLQDICSGPDGNLWATGYTSNKIYKVTTGGSFTSYSTGISASAGLYSICSGPDGNLWFTEFSANKIGKITTGGSVTEYSTGITASSQPLGIDSDGTSLWFGQYATGPAGNKVSKITTGGTVTEYAISTSSFRPGGVMKGPDGRMWVGSFNTQKCVAVTVSDGTRTEYTIASGTFKPYYSTVVGNTIWYLLYDGTATQKVQVVNTDGTTGFTTANVPTSGTNVQNKFALASDGRTLWLCGSGSNPAGGSPTVSRMLSYRIFDQNRGCAVGQAVNRAGTY